MMRFVLLLLAGLASTHAREIRWSAPIEIASGGGERGPWRQNDSVWDFVDDPTVVLRNDDTAGVVWVDQKRKDVFFQLYQRNGRATLKTPVNVSRSPQVFSWLPRLALSPVNGEHIYALWQEIVFSGGSHGGETFFARSTDGGRTFEAPLNLSNSRNGDGKGRTSKDHWHNGSHDLVVGPDGTIYAGWTEYDGPLWCSRSSDGGRSFSKPIHLIGTENRPARAPAMAIGKENRLYLAWTFGEDSSADIHLAVVENGKASEPVIVAKTRDYSDAPKLALTADGTLHVVFSEYPSGREAAGYVHYVRSTNAGRSFDPARRISGQGGGFPSFAASGKRLLVAWESYRGPGEQPRGFDYAISLDGGAIFSEPEPVPESTNPDGGHNGSSQGKLMRKLALHDSGWVAIVNSSFHEGRKSRVWLIFGQL